MLSTVRTGSWKRKKHYWINKLKKKWNSLEDVKIFLTLKSKRRNLVCIFCLQCVVGYLLNSSHPTPYVLSEATLSHKYLCDMSESNISEQGEVEEQAVAGYIKTFPQIPFVSE